jgi:flagellar hook assembly protein FlgD
VDGNQVRVSLAGRRVKTLVSENVNAGEHAVQWNGRDDHGQRVSSGVYLYQLRAEEFVETKRMVLLK